MIEDAPTSSQVVEQQGGGNEGARDQGVGDIGAGDEDAVDQDQGAGDEGGRRGGRLRQFTFRFLRERVFSPLRLSPSPSLIRKRRGR